MCGEITFLVEQDDFRFVAICEHNIIHLGWDRLVIYLQLEEFLALDGTLDRAIAGIGDFVLPSDAIFSQESDGIFLLQIYEVTLRLHKDDFSLLAEMVSMATEQVSPDGNRAVNPDIAVTDSNSKCTPIKSFVCPNRTNRTEND